jgi:hypothetical protein
MDVLPRRGDGSSVERASEARPAKSSSRPATVRSSAWRTTPNAKPRGGPRQVVIGRGEDGALVPLGVATGLEDPHDAAQIAVRVP